MTNSEAGLTRTNAGTRGSSTWSKGGVMTKGDGTPVTRNGLQISDEISTPTSGMSTPTADHQVDRESRPVPPLRPCDGCPVPSCDGCPIAADPEFFRAIEKRDKRVVRRTWIVAFLAVLYLFTMAYFIVGTHEVVNSHNTEITQTEKLVKQVRTLQQEHAGDLKAIKYDTNQVSLAVTTLQALAQNNHSTTSANIGLICAKLQITGCAP